MESKHLDEVELVQVPSHKIPELNHAQKRAVQKAMKSSFTLIQGPPGTGKTVTAAHLVYNLAKAKIKTQIEGVERIGAINTKILVCAPSNAASDILAKRILLTGLSIIRMYSKKREIVPLDPKLEKVTLHCLTKQEMPESSEFNPEKKILDGAHVIVCTCSVSADDRLNDYRFKYVVVDESTQSVEPESILPLLRGCEKAIFIGDHMQLGPVVQDDYAS